MESIARVGAQSDGQEFTKNGTFDANVGSDAGWRIISINFFNQGQNSIAVVRVGGADIELEPGQRSITGASLNIDMPVAYFDQSHYLIKFRSGGSETTPRIDLLKVTFIKTKACQ